MTSRALAGQPGVHLRVGAHDLLVADVEAPRDVGERVLLAWPRRPARRPTTSSPGLSSKRWLATGSGICGGGWRRGRGGGGGAFLWPAEQGTARQGSTACTRRGAGRGNYGSSWTPIMDHVRPQADCRRCATAARAGSAARCRSRGVPGKCRPSSAPTPRMPHDRALLEAPVAIVVLHLPAHGLPFRLAHVGGDAAVGDDLHVMVGHEHVDEDAVVVRGVPDAELAEHLQRTLARAPGRATPPAHRRRSRRRSGSPRRGGPRTRRCAFSIASRTGGGKCRRVP